MLILEDIKEHNIMPILKGIYKDVDFFHAVLSSVCLRAMVRGSQ